MVSYSTSYEKDLLLSRRDRLLRHLVGGCLGLNSEYIFFCSGLLLHCQAWGEFLLPSVS